MSEIVIVGGGVAGFSAAQIILSKSMEHRVTMICDEPSMPYDRPELSKAFLSAEARPVRELGPDLFKNPAMRLVRSTRVIEIDADNRQVVTDKAERHAYDTLILATGSRPRRLPPNVAADGAVSYFRNADDAASLRNQLLPNARVVIIGGGFIGLELAAVARARGATAIVVEAGPRLLARGCSDRVGDWFARLHRGQGVDIRLSTIVDGVCRQADGTCVVETTQGALTADIVLAGIGVLPNIELARAAGLSGDEGIVVDAHCRTALPGVLAAGEVTSYPIAMLGVYFRSECWTAAGNQGAVAGLTAIGAKHDGFCELPWLWSDQYSANFQSLGMPALGVETTIYGSIETGQWLEIFWNPQGQMTGALAVNSGHDISKLRRFLRNGVVLRDHIESQFLPKVST